MRASNDAMTGFAGSLRRAADAVRRAFTEFLSVPTATITAFVLLAGLAYLLDRNTPAWLSPERRFLQRHVFIDSNTTSEFLTAIAGGIITVTSITVSVLLLAVQQAAGSMSGAVFDQFLRRRQNQVSFGFFTGLALYTLITLATVHQRQNAVFGATLAFVLTVAALYALLLLLYSTVDQMRPSVVIESIGRMAGRARRGQLALIERTRRVATTPAGPCPRVAAAGSGYVTRIDLALLEQALERSPRPVEIVLLVSVGAFVAIGDDVAELRSADGVDAGDELEPLADTVRRALHLEFGRDIARDPAFGIDQISNIGWTSISSSKSNPAPGLFAIRTLRDLLAHWAIRPEPDSRDAAPCVLPVVYPDDTVWRAYDALESFGVAAYESKQHQTVAEVLLTLALLLPRLDDAQRARAGDIVERLLPSLSIHIRTAVLDHALGALAQSLAATGAWRVLAAVRAARRQ